MSKVILYIATSQDGFIADKDGDVNWLSQPEDDSDLEVVGYKNLMQRIDTIIMGSNSYKQILGFGNWACVDKKTYVFTSQNIQSEVAHVTNETPFEFMAKLKEQQLKKDIWLLGGAKLAQSFAKYNLIDEIILTTVPQILGDGIAIDLNLNDLKLMKEKSLRNCMIQQTYFRR